ncbi:MAG: hypothetical protein HC887_05980 [Desulfobacteraceae bacterium]|nr:hypothetical protein [Desulfobacteraceae bacterium]
MEIFKDKDACLGSVMEVGEALYGENARSREMCIHVRDHAGQEIPVLGIPVRLSETPGKIRTAPPKFGENTRDILKEFGFSDE